MNGFNKNYVLVNIYAKCVYVWHARIVFLLIFKINIFVFILKIVAFSLNLGQSLEMRHTIICRGVN